MRVVDSTDASTQVYTQQVNGQTPSVEPTPKATQQVGQVSVTEDPAQKVYFEELGINLPKNLFNLNNLEKGELSISEKQFIQEIEKANKAAIGRNTSFRFSVHEATKRISIKVLDADTNEIIREIPPEKVLDLVAKLYEMSGMFVDERR